MYVPNYVPRTDDQTRNRSEILRASQQSIPNTSAFEVRRMLSRDSSIKAVNNDVANRHGIETAYHTVSSTAMDGHWGGWGLWGGLASLLLGHFGCDQSQSTESQR